MKHTPLYECHVRDASEILNLKGTARAMHYCGHLEEHRLTREAVSLCDVSHMGEIDFQGPDAFALVQTLITNDASKLAVNQALYSAMCTGDGLIIDDLVCFRLGSEHFRWVVNVTKIDEDYQWVKRHSLGLNVKVRDISTDTALLALQGPNSREVLQRITKADLSGLKYYWFVQTMVRTERGEVPCLVSRTGYTGEIGYEIMVDRELAPWVWDELLMVGRPLGIVAQGVAARESLRTEAGYLLNGNDMDAKTNPFEAGLGWVVKLTKDFVGKQALEQMKAKGVSRKMVGLEVDGHLTVRNGYPIYRNGKEIGRVSSGPLSAALTGGRNLGLGYVGVEHAEPGTDIEVEIRGKKSKGRVVPMPFCKRSAKDEPAVTTYSPYDLRFSDSHLWARIDDARGDVITLGLSDYGQRNLGDVLCVNLPRVGDRISRVTVAGWMESYRKTYDIIAPATGEVVEIDQALEQQPTRINAYPYACTGIVKIRVENTRDCDELMRFDAYSDLIHRLRRYDSWTKDLRMT